MRLAQIAAATTLFTLLSGCGVASDLEISNESDQPVLAVAVSDGRNSWELGDLPAGESVNFDGRLAGEGGPLVSWTFKGERYSERGCYYSEPMTGAEGAIMIQGERLNFRCL